MNCNTTHYRANSSSVPGDPTRATLERAGAGIAVTPGDVEMLTDAIANLAANPEGRARMALAGGDFVDREFSRKSWAEAYIAVLDGLVGRSGISEPAPVVAMR